MPNPRPTLRQIEAFLAAADLGGFSRAAERLGISQPALSQLIRELEALLDLRLLHRTTRRVALTTEGRAFRDRVAPGLVEIDRAVTEARGRARLSQGVLRIAAPPLLAATVLPQAMSEFSRAHPGVVLSLADLPTDEIVARLRGGRVDLGVGTFPPGLPDLERRPLMRDTLMLFCPEAHPLARQAAPGWAGLEGAALITLTRESGIRLLVEIGFERAGHALVPAQEVTQIATALALVAAGAGVAVLPGYARVAAGPGVVCLPLAGIPISREICAMLPRDAAPGPVVPVFLERLARGLRGSAP